jgi:hypothetical protein
VSWSRRYTSSSFYRTWIVDRAFRNAIPVTGADTNFEFAVLGRADHVSSSVIGDKAFEFQQKLHQVIDNIVQFELPFQVRRLRSVFSALSMWTTPASPFNQQ